MASFSQRTRHLTEIYRQRLNFIARESVKQVIEESQVTRTNGGNMRFRTGFLRASGQAEIGQLPTGPTRNEDGTKYPEGSQVSGIPHEDVIDQWFPARGKSIYFGWTANYARWREYQDGFLRLGVMKWKKIVRKNIDRAKKEIKPLG